MDNYSLKLFLHLSESLHFAKTSQTCNISPSALSRQIQRMEDELGHKLFERDNRTVKLTHAGILFAEYAREVQLKWQTLMDRLMEESGTLKGEISLYCSVTASLGILPSLLDKFRTTHPKIQIKLQTGDAASALKKVSNREVDIAVAALPEALPKNLTFKPITKTPLVFIAPKVSWEFSHLLTGVIPWHIIPMILSEHGLARKRTDTWFREKGIKPNIYARVSGNEAILSMVNLGCGVGVVPYLVVKKSPLRKNVTILKVNPKLAPYTVGICVQKRKIQSPLVQAFWDI